MVFENVVIGKPICDFENLFAFDSADWKQNEQKKTYFTNERFLPAIMVKCGLVKNISEVKRNQPKLCITLENPDFLQIKWGKKFLFVCVGEKEDLR